MALTGSDEKDLTLEKQLELKDKELQNLRKDLFNADKQIRNQARYINLYRTRLEVANISLEVEKHRTDCYLCKKGNVRPCDNGLQLGGRLRNEVFKMNMLSTIEDEEREAVSGARLTEFGRESREGEVSDYSLRTGKVKHDKGGQKTFEKRRGAYNV